MAGHDPDTSTYGGSPLEPEVVLEFSTLQEFLDAQAARLSNEGIFLEVQPREPIGSPVRFELRLEEGYRLLRGEGVVTWIRDPAPGTDGDTGIAVRFVYLDEGSRKLLPVLLEHYRKLQVPAFELEAGDQALPRRPIEMGEPGQLTLEDLAQEFTAAEQSATAEVPSELTGIDVPPLEDVLVDAEYFGTASEAEPGGDAGELKLATATSAAEDMRLEEFLSLPDLAASGEPTASDEVAVESERQRPTEPAAESVPAVDAALGLPVRNKLVDAETGEIEMPPEDLEAAAAAAAAGSGRGGRWLLILVAVISAALGAAFYFRFLQKDPVAEPQATAVPEVTVPAPSEEPAAEFRAEELAAESTVPMPVEESAQQEVAEPTEEDEPLAPPEESLPAATLTLVERITWQESQGETVVTLWGDGVFAADAIKVFRLDENSPRQLFRIAGIERPFAQRNVEVGSSHIQRVRTGLHTGSRGVELHVVADLQDAQVQFDHFEFLGSQLHLHFSRP